MIMKTILKWTIIWILTVLTFTTYHYIEEYTLNKRIYNHITILKSTIDLRNLTSIIYIDLKGDTVARDYLTYIELRNLY